MSVHHSFKLPVAGGVRRKEPAGQRRRHKRSGFDSWVDPLERGQATTLIFLGCPGGSDRRALPEGRETGVRSLGWEDSPGGGHGNPLQCSCLGNAMERGAWRTSVHGVTNRGQD